MEHLPLDTPQIVGEIIRDDALRRDDRKSWFTVARVAFAATGKVRRRMPERMTISTELPGTKLAAEAAAAASVM